MSLIDYLESAFEAVSISALQAFHSGCQKAVKELEPKVDEIIKEYEDVMNLANVVERAISAKKAENEQRAKDADDKTDWGEVLRFWNALAGKQGLVVIDRMSPARKKAWAAMEKMYPDFRELLTDAVCNKRGKWYQERQMPSFKQATNKEKFLELKEGGWNRNDPGEKGNKAERVSSFIGTTE